MMNSSPSPALKPGFAFPGWSAALAADDSLSAGLREAYRQILSRFLQFAAQRRAGPSVAGAREFVELARLEQAPSPARLAEWQAALNWFFRRGREVSAVLRKGVPPLARADLGGPAWEVALIAHLRQRGRSWRTEETYRGWLWRFEKWLAEAARGDARPTGEVALAEVGEKEIRDFLSMLAVQERCSLATQKQALNALVVYFRDVAGAGTGGFQV